MSIKVVLVLIALVLAALLWRQWQEHRASADWPFVEGVITHAEAVPDTPDPTDPAMTRNWKAEVRYDYSVKGQSYVGDRLKAAPWRYPREEDARQALSAFPAGQRVKVFYDPASPDRSVLQPGTTP